MADEQDKTRDSTPVPDPRGARLTGFAIWVLFAIIGFVLFAKELNR